MLVENWLKEKKELSRVPFGTEKYYVKKIERKRGRKEEKIGKINKKNRFKLNKLIIYIYSNSF